MEAQVKLLLDLRGLRKEAGVKLEKVLQQCGLERSVYARCEKGAEPKLGTALKVARLLQMPVEEIWSLADEPPQRRGPIVPTPRIEDQFLGAPVVGDPGDEGTETGAESEKENDQSASL
jgi:DNA-binding XRE family transcriptional regulator